MSRQLAPDLPTPEAHEPVLDHMKLFFLNTVAPYKAVAVACAQADYHQCPVEFFWHGLLYTATPKCDMLPLLIQLETNK